MMVAARDALIVKFDTNVWPTAVANVWFIYLLILIYLLSPPPLPQRNRNFLKFSTDIALNYTIFERAQI